MNKVAAFALRRKNSILSMSEKMFCPPQPLRFWITPAYAGKSECNSSSNDARWDHPPRMRGKEVQGLLQDLVGGITPAYAGKRRPPMKSHRTARDHPRMCGEKLCAAVRNAELMGSPPRVRGKVQRLTGPYHKDGITPAHAGKSPARVADYRAGEDHPRACGEKARRKQKATPQQGSPPRVRGKGNDVGCLRQVHGITPAYAGKRRATIFLAIHIEDHPRVCGEKFHPASDRKLGRVRGTKRSSGPAPAAAPAGLAGSCPASPPWSYPPRITVSRPRP